MVVTIDNYVLIPNLVQSLDADAHIPEKHYYPAGVGEVRKDISDLARARLRIMWIIGTSLQHYRKIFVDRLGPAINE